MCSFPALLSLCEYQASRKSLSWKLRALSTIVAWSKSILWTNWFACCATLELLSPTRTDKYLDYNSHHPSQHKRSVVNTLLHRAQKIPSTNAERSRERKHVIKVLRDNNYPPSFIRSCKSYHNSSRRDSSTNGSSSASTSSASPFVVLPYVTSVSEKISRVLRNNGVKVGYKPINVLRTCSPRPKDKPPVLQCRGVVYRVACVDCNFVYYGQTDRALETRLKEHKRAVRVGDNNSKVEIGSASCRERV